MSVNVPDLPAVFDYPTQGSHAHELEAARALFDQELASPDAEWDDAGERDGVQLWTKTDPDDPYAVPTVKGEAIVKDATSEAFLGGVVQLPGMRKLWDPRFEGGHMLARYDRTTFAFWTVMKGMGWLVHPRDIVGVQKNYHPEDGNPKGERFVVQTSVDEPKWAPEQKGKTRATLALSGWRLTPLGEDLKLTYVVKIALNGSIPPPMVTMVATETPLCTGRARDVYAKFGHAPFVRIPRGSPEPSTTFQTELFSDPPSSLADLVANHPREYRCVFTTGSSSNVGEVFEIVYDRRRMYPEGVSVRCEHVGAEEAVELEDDGEGTVRVATRRSGIDVTVVITPK
ncbi:START domain-containing protein [Rhodotorula paludigena]|uniref:START domain-containing protein n=1 Tax=Rhodotorula paludigena TaxID=86838 RepID=UPI0031736F8F